jgi:hypothetical protein
MVDGVRVELTPEEIAELSQVDFSYDSVAKKAESVRDNRNMFLQATDWSQGTDVPQAIKDKYTTYRQALRDIPTQAGFPDSVQWPTQPE